MMRRSYTSIKRDDQHDEEGHGSINVSKSDYLCFHQGDCVLCKRMPAAMWLAATLVGLLVFLYLNYNYILFIKPSNKFGLDLPPTNETCAVPGSFYSKHPEEFPCVREVQYVCQRGKTNFFPLLQKDGSLLSRKLIKRPRKSDNCKIWYNRSTPFSPCFYQDYVQLPNLERKTCEELYWDNLPNRNHSQELEANSHD